MKNEADCAEKMRGADPHWIGNPDSRAGQIQTQLLGKPARMLMNKMQRNPATWHVEVSMGDSDAEKKKLMKFQWNRHAWEMRESHGYWHLVLA